MNVQDLQIIYELQKDPRKQNTELAEKLGMSEASVRRHISELIKSKTLIPTAIPATSKLGYGVRAFIGIQVEVAKIDTIAKKLIKYQELQYIAICAGFMDITLYGIFKSHSYLSEFLTSKLAKIEGIINIETMMELKCLKQTYGRLQKEGLPGCNRMVGENEPTISPLNSGISKKFTKIKIDQLDRRLIAELQRNSRRSNRELAKILGVSEATVRRRIHVLLSSRTIELTAIPHPNKVGLSTLAYLNLRVELPKLESVAEKLVKYMDVHYVGICSGPYHLLVTVIFSSPVELSRFITKELGKIKGIVRSDTLVHLDYEKRAFGWLYPGKPPW